jgi:hypothetical protein
MRDERLELARYRELARFYEEKCLVDDARWINAHYASLVSPVSWQPAAEILSGAL